jgi:hypothetical protein
VPGFAFKTIVRQGRFIFGKTGVDSGQWRTGLNATGGRLIDDPGEQLKKQLEEAFERGNGPRAARFALACLRVIPGVGGAIAGTAGSWSEKEHEEYNRIFSAWLKLPLSETEAE